MASIFAGLSGKPENKEVHQLWSHVTSKVRHPTEVHVPKDEGVIGIFSNVGGGDGIMLPCIIISSSRWRIQFNSQAERENPKPALAAFSSVNVATRTK